MTHFRPAFFVTGLFLIGLAVFMWVPLIYMRVLNEDGWRGISAVQCDGIECGRRARLSSSGSAGFTLVPRQVFVLTTLTWLSVSMFAALPMLFIQHINYTDAFFETMSGLTTTGSTVLVGLDQASRGLLLWRSLLHWIGGSGSLPWG